MKIHFINFETVEKNYKSDFIYEIIFIYFDVKKIKKILESSKNNFLNKGKMKDFHIYFKF